MVAVDDDRLDDRAGRIIEARLIAQHDHARLGGRVYSIAISSETVMAALRRSDGFVFRTAASDPAGPDQPE